MTIAVATNAKPTTTRANNELPPIAPNGSIPLAGTESNILTKNEKMATEAMSFATSFPVSFGMEGSPSNPSASAAMRSL